MRKINENVVKLSKPIKLDILKEQHFYPPQGFRYATANEAAWFNELTTTSVKECVIV